MKGDEDGIAVVGIGASAGGLAALSRLLENVPAENGLAWVVITHLSPNHESHMATLLQAHTTMPVRQVTEEIELEKDRVYVIPPNRNLSSIDSHLRLVSLEESRQARAPIDHFFRTLAETHGVNAIGVVLSGSGSDGALGLGRIKEMGGLPIVQELAEAEYDSMPRSAIAMGQVDLVLPVAEIPAQIIAYLQRSNNLPSVRAATLAPGKVNSNLQQLLTLVRVHTGQDFSRYRSGTILRRVQHRMQLLGVGEVEHYLGRLRTNLGEVQTLSNDFLISVTNFFRDRAAFDLLAEEVIPNLFTHKGRDEQLRVWVVGCATGEEAYMLGMLLLEHAGQLDHPPQLQIFASDLSDGALRRAREGIYPETIAQDVSGERPARFFVQEQGLAHLTHKLGYPYLLDDANQVLRTLVPIQREIKSEADDWYLTRIIPYRSLDDRIEGVVITLVEITHQKETELALRQSQERYQYMSESGMLAIAIANTEGAISEANGAFHEQIGSSQADLDGGGLHWDQLTPPEWVEQTRQAFEQLTATGRIVPYEREYLRKDGTRFWGLAGGARLAGTDKWVTFVFDITPRKQAEVALRRDGE